MTLFAVHRPLPNKPQASSSPQRKTTLRTAVLGSLTLGLLGLGSPANAQASGKHVHGLAELNIAIEPRSMTLTLTSPLDNLLGFEHAPRNDAERARVATAQKTLKNGGSLFTLDDAGNCQPTHINATELYSHRAHSTHAGHAHDTDTHNDAELTVEYACKSGDTLQFIDAKPLFDAFPRLQTLQVQVAGPKGQSGMTLPRAKPRIALTK